MVERVAATDHPVDARSEVLRLGCAGRPTDDAAAVRCLWSAPMSDAAVGIRLVRSSRLDDTRQVVFRTDDLDVTEFVDAPVRRGVRDRYALQAIDADGRVVGMSRPATAGVPTDEPSSVEVVRLECATALGDPSTAERVSESRRSRRRSTRRTVMSCQSGPAESSTQ
jgi:hypothetical protein